MMSTGKNTVVRVLGRAPCVLAAGLLAWSVAAAAADVTVQLSGADEVPPVDTRAAGSGVISVNADMSVSGKVSTTGIAGSMAHIHMGAAGQNGPVLIHLVKDGDSGWLVPAGAKLTEEQYRAFQAGGLYVNVHSAEHKAGEIRGQLKP